MMNPMSKKFPWAPESVPASGLASVLLVVLLTACGGGGSGGGGAPPPIGPEPLPPATISASAVIVSKVTPFAMDCLQSGAGSIVYVDSELEPHIAVDPADQNHLIAAWQQDRLAGGGALGLVSAVSVDGGLQWSGPLAFEYTVCGGGESLLSSDPWVSIGPQAAYHAGIAFSGAASDAGPRSTVVVSRSVDGGFSWGKPTLVADDPGDELFNDKETVTADAWDERYVYVVWDRISSDDQGPTRLARSVDGGLSWEPARTIYDPGPGRQTIGNEVVILPGGLIFLFFSELGPSLDEPDALAADLKVMRSMDHGVTWSDPVQIAEIRSVGTSDPSRPEVKVRAGEIIGSFAGGPVDNNLYAVWQDARYTGGAHDAIVLSKSSDNGATWSEPARVNADASVPAFVPTLALMPDGTIGVSYYDFRPPRDERALLTNHWLAVSRDGINWNETLLAERFDMLNAPDAGGRFVGDYQGLASYETGFLALFAIVNNGDSANRTDLYADRVDGFATASVRQWGHGKSLSGAWSRTAQQRVNDNLAAAKARRTERWKALLREASLKPDD
jgi:hypothetical protein